jgi:RNA polymerase sigma-70 factor (ECF subfamily)
MNESSEDEDRRPGRIEAFETVVSAFEAPLLRYASRILNDRNAAQDAVQEAFLRFFRYWREEIDQSPRVSAWLYRVAHNCAVDHLRGESRRHLLHRRHAEEIEPDLPPDRGSEFRISDAAARAAAALQSLPLRERQLVVLKVYEEKSYKEIADITGLSTGNVGYILHHAMKKLAAELKKADAG